jgi:hypothetical protein
MHAHAALEALDEEPSRMWTRKTKQFQVCGCAADADKTHTCCVEGRIPFVVLVVAWPPPDVLQSTASKGKELCKPPDLQDRSLRGTLCLPVQQVRLTVSSGGEGCILLNRCFTWHFCFCRLAPSQPTLYLCSHLPSASSPALGRGLAALLLGRPLSIILMCTTPQPPPLTIFLLVPRSYPAGSHHRTFALDSLATWNPVFSPPVDDPSSFFRSYFNCHSSNKPARSTMSRKGPAPLFTLAL